MGRARGRAAIAILTLAAGAAGCFTPQPLPYPPQRIALGLFSFVPPDEPGWVTTPSGGGAFDAGRRGASVDETWALVAQLRPAELDLTSDEILLARGREAMLGGPKMSADGRYEYKSIDLTLWPKLGAHCLRVENVSIDRTPARASGSDHPMVMSTIIFLCIHPRAPDHAISLGLSQRCDEGSEQMAQLRERAEALGSTLEFAEPPAP